MARSRPAESSAPLPAGPPKPAPLRAAEVVVPCPDLPATVEFFTDRLGFRTESVFPADDPRIVVVAGFGVRLRLERSQPSDSATGGDTGTSPQAPWPGRLRIECASPPPAAAQLLIAPNGMRIELVAADRPVVVPPCQPSWTVTHAEGEAAWHLGRAGMRYRDLVPDRQGGAFIASHIAVPRGGAVPDYVHFHRIRFQMIYCVHGWVDLVYEDQGPPFRMRAGDCVLQPPRIRHRVLRCSDALEVVEVGVPAEHETLVDHEIALPTAHLDRGREFEGQRFHFHEAATAIWTRHPQQEGAEVCDLGMAAATRDLADARVVRGRGSVAVPGPAQGGELRFGFVLEGAVMLRAGTRAPVRLARASAFVVPPRSSYSLDSLEAATGDVSWLEVALPVDVAAARG